MSKEETVKALVIKYSIPINAAYDIWNAAISAAAESAYAKQQVKGMLVSAYVDKQSILDLRFNK